MKKHAEHESEVPGAQTVPEGAAANQAENGKGGGYGSGSAKHNP